MKRFLLWIISVALGVALLLAAVMGVSYAFTTQGGCPDAAAQFGGQELETNGFCWQVPLLGGRLDKVFASPATLTVQKLAPGHYSAGLGQLHHSDHPDRGRQCGVCRQRERIPELPLPGQRRIQGRNDPLARAQGRHGHPVRGRQHRCPAQKSGVGAPRKAHGVVPVFLPVHPAGQRGHRVLRRAGGAGRHRGCAHLRNDRRHRPCRGDRPWQCAVRARRRRLACLHPGGL